MNTDRRQRCKRWRWLGCILLSGYLISCTQAEVEEREPSPAGGETVEAQFNIEVKGEENGFTKAGTDSLQTRAVSSLTEVEERSIKTLWVGQYVGGVLQNGGMEGAYISAVDLAFIKVLLKSSSERSTVYLVTNAGNLGTPNEATLKTMIKNYGSTGSSVEAGVKSSGLIMIGKWEGMVNSSYSSGTPFEKTVEVERLAAKIRFRYSFPTVSGFTFTPKSLALRSVPNGSQYLEPDGQPSSGITYVDIPASSYTNGDQYWYIPENKAGRGNREASEKEKTGTGKTNATYIELTGDALQEGVTYSNVSFKFYPGSDSSDYSIRRNHSYLIDIEIRGIDFTDKRVTVGGNTTDVNSLALGATKGASATLTTTVQPGKNWTCTFPDWLLASGTDITNVSSTQISGRGPAAVLFTTLSVNPQGNARSGSITVTPDSENAGVVAVSQTNSVLGSLSNTRTTGSGSYVKGDAGKITIGTTTEGLPWQASVSANWISLAGNTGKTWQSAQTDNKQFTYSILYTNPFTSTQTATVTAYGGNDNTSVNTGLRKTLSITQPSSSITASANPTAIAAGGGTSTVTVTAPAGLAWGASVSGTGYSLNTTSGTGNGSLTVTATSSAATTGTVMITAQKGSHGGSGTLASKSISITKSSSSIELKPNDQTDNEWDNDFKLIGAIVDVPNNSGMEKGIIVGAFGSGAIIDRNGKVSTPGKLLVVEKEESSTVAGRDLSLDSGGKDICGEKGEGWYMPSPSQMVAIAKTDFLETTEFSLSRGDNYWTNEIVGSGVYTVVYYYYTNNVSLLQDYDDSWNKVRCVRDL